MISRRARALLLGVVAAGAGAAGCSLDVLKNHDAHSLSIHLQKTQADGMLLSTLDALWSGKPPRRHIRTMGSTPTSISDFTCFAADIAGNGIPPDSGGQIADCTVAPGIGVGIIPDPVSIGESINVSVPAGTGRTVYAFGIFPEGDSCGGDGSGGNGAGYLLGQVTQDIVADTSITVPISFATGSSAVVKCTGHSGSNFQSFSLEMDGTEGTGVYSSTCISSATINPSAPVPGSLSPVASFSGVDYAAMATQDSSLQASECSFSGSFDTQVVVFSFFVGANATTGATDLFLDWVGAAGIYSGSCTQGSLTGAGGGSPRVEIWNANTSSWIGAGAISTSQFSITSHFSNVSDFLSSGTVFVRIIGATSSSSQCSSIQTDSVSLTFH